MNEDNYINELIEKTDIKEDDIFNYEDSPYIDDFTTTIEFYIETLEILRKFGIEKVFYFLKTIDILMPEQKHIMELE